MPQPTLTDAHVDSLLTDVSVAYLQDEGLFVASKIFPDLGVAKQSNLYRTYNKNDFRRNEMKRLAPGSESFEAGFNLSTAQYSCDVFALGHFVDDQLKANYDDPGDAEEDSIKHLMQMAMISMESEFMGTYFTTGVWANDVTPGTLWGSDLSDPRADVQTGVKTILLNTGFKPNTMLVGFDVHQALQKHVLIREQFKYTSAESIDSAMLARFFNVDRYIVSEASYSTNNEGETDANALIAGKHALLCYSAPNPSLMAPSAGYTFTWTGLVGSGGAGARALRFEMPWRHGVKLEVQAAYDHKVVASDLGYMLASVVA